MSEGTQQTANIFCNTCKTLTKHVLQKRYSTPRVESGDDDYPDPIRMAHRYTLWSCAGCGEATLEKQWASEDKDEEWEGGAGGGEYYPRRLRDSIQAKVFTNLNNEVALLYKEIVASFNEDCLLLCAIGCRALVERICVDKGITDEITGKDLRKKIDLLIKFLPSPNLIECLQSLRLFGNDAAHQLAALTRDEERSAIEVMEHLLDHFYEMDYKASQGIPKHPKNVSLDSVKPGSVQ